MRLEHWRAVSAVEAERTDFTTRMKASVAEGLFLKKVCSWRRPLRFAMVLTLPASIHDIGAVLKLERLLLCLKMAQCT